MSTHLTDAELKGFAEGRLQPPDLMRADDHLAECGDCRVRGAALNDLMRASAAVKSSLNSAGLHLSEEQVRLAASGELDPSQRPAFEHHLQACQTCSQHVEELRAWSVRPARRVRPLSIAAAILLAALVPALLWQVLPPHRKTDASLAGLTELSASDQVQVRAALDAGVGRLPDFMDDLMGSRETLMSPAPPAVDAFTLTSPVATATTSDRPAFRWRSLPGSTSYVVTIFDEQSNEVMHSSSIDQLTWVPDRPLARDRTYVWQVAARRNGETIVAPVAPLPPAKFHVVDAHTAGVIERAESQQPQSHVFLGILNMNAGVVDSAIQHFQQVGPTDPRAELAGRSLDRLRLLRKP